MQGIPIIVTRLADNGKINITSTIMNTRQDNNYANSKVTQIYQETENKNNKRKKQPRMKASIQYPIDYLSEDQKINPKFNTLDNQNYRMRKHYQKQIQRNSRHINKFNIKARGRTEDAEPYLIKQIDTIGQDEKQKQNLVRVRRIQSSGARRKLPKDFFSRESTRPKKNLQDQNRLSEHSSKQIKPREWTTIQPQHLHKRQTYKQESILTDEQKIEIKQTPKFKQKSEFTLNNRVFGTEKKYGVSSQGDIYQSSLGKLTNLQKFFNLEAGKKKNYCAKSKKKQTTEKEYSPKKKIESNKKLKLKNNQYEAHGQLLIQNATFGKNQWGNNNLKIENTLKEQTQKENMPASQCRKNHIVQPKKMVMSSFREAYGQKISGIKEKTNYFKVKKIMGADY